MKYESVEEALNKKKEEKTELEVSNIVCAIEEVSPRK